MPEEMKAISESRESYIKIKGGSVLEGEVEVSGAKNAILPLLFSSLLAEGTHEFYNVPDLKDVSIALQILESLGFLLKKEGSSLQVISSYKRGSFPSKELVGQMRASILCLGPLLSRFGEARIPFPGGCVIGARPIDLHLKGLKSFGAHIEVEEGIIYARAPKGLKGAKIVLDFPTVGGTENLIMAAVLAQGQSWIQNAAIEPEVLNLVGYLKKMGAKIEFSSREIKIEGVTCLKPFSGYFVIPDRIEAGTLLLAGAITGGEIVLRNCCPDHLLALRKALQCSGFFLESDKNEIRLESTKKREALDLGTEVYPGFPSDLQSQFMALMTQLKGLSSLTENIFEDRFRHVLELRKLGASIELKENRRALVHGPVSLKGTDLRISDLRAGAGLILAALVAKGESRVFSLHHLDRGYENLDQKLRSLGANIERIS